MKPALPPSQTDTATGLIGLAAAVGVLALLRGPLHQLSPLLSVGLVLLAGALPPILADLFYFKRWREASAGLGARRKLDGLALLRKCFGLLLTLVSFGLLYRLLPEYQSLSYIAYWRMLFVVLPYLLAATPFYFAWCLTREDMPRDGYDELAWLALGRIRGRDWREIGRHYRNWLVKAFFLPLMFVYSVDAVGGLVEFDAPFSVGWYDLANRFIMFADLLFATIGYVLTLRLLNAHIRSSEPTLGGWVVALACYAPFWQNVFYPRYFPYDQGMNWIAMLNGHPVLHTFWACAILALLAIYSLATICMGIRFSNLTYRGLITSGPYGFCKHPAYVAKNLSWWLASVPFMHGGWLAVADCAMLFMVNVIYYIRARTEENHLSNYPEYVEYALAMNERSIFRGLTKFLPFLKYQVPANPPKI